MACQKIPLSGRGFAIVCGPRPRQPRRRCVVCNIPDTMATMRLCDGPGTQAGRTCDAPVCIECAVHQDPDTDYCAAHAHLGHG